MRRTDRGGFAWVVIAPMTLLALLALGCEVSPPTAHSPRWGKEACHTCRMAVSEPPHAAQWLGPGSQVRYYDDLGCALKDEMTGSAPAGGMLYVPAPDSAGEKWVPATQVRYAAEVQTPMNYGYSPSATGSLTIDDIKAALRAKHGSDWQLPPARGASR